MRNNNSKKSRWLWLFCVVLIVHTTRAFLVARQRHQQLRVLHPCLSAAQLNDDDSAYERYRKRQLRKKRTSKRKQKRRTLTAILSPVDSIPLSELLKELDQLQIRYAPDASRRDLEALWNAHQQQQQHDEDEEPIQQQQQKQHEENFRIHERENNDYSDDDRQDEQIIKIPSQQDTSQTRLHKPSSLFGTNQHSKQQRRWQRVIRKALSNDLPQTVKQSLKQRAKGTIRRTARTFKHMKEEWDQVWQVDDQIIRNVDYQYLRRDDPIDVKAVPLVEHQHKQNHVDKVVEAERSELEIIPQQSSMNASMKMTLQPQPSRRQRRPKPRSSPSFPTELKSASSFERPKHQKRRIYNPYNNYSPDMDSIDRIGQFLADSVDQLFWGQYDPNNEPSQQEERKQKRHRHQRPADPKTRTSSRPQQHWKDRLEERFDSMMGIHKDGEVYNRWLQEEEEAGDEHAPNKSPRRKRNTDKPFWEEESSLMALLFGRTKGGQQLSWEKVLAPRGQGSLVTIFRSVTQTTLILASYVFRWASVRGAIPQPVVVLGVSAAGLCVRQHRLRAMLLALILLRTVGELVHGGLYGQDGWEDGVTDELEPEDGTASS